MDTIKVLRNVVATDIVAVKLMGLDPPKITYIRMAHEKGLVNIENMT